MLAGDAEGAIAWGRRAIKLGHATSVSTRWSCTLRPTSAQRSSASGRLDEGRALLEVSLEGGLANGDPRAARQGPTTTWCRQRSITTWLWDARDYLAAGIAYCLKRDLDTWRLNIEEAAAAEVELMTGAWDQALVRCRSILENSGASATRVTALLVAGTIGIRRGDPDARDNLDEAFALAGRGRNPGLGDTRGDGSRRGGVDRTLTDPQGADRGRPHLVSGVRDQERLVDRHARLVVGAVDESPAWLTHRAALRPDARPAGGPSPQRSGRAPATRSGGPSRWPDPTISADARTAHEQLVELGASATLRAAAREWQRRGVPVPRGRRPAPERSHGLTARELEVLHLLCEGLSNHEIAHTLVLAPKTVGHHVSAVLQKLEAPTRARATARARQLGIVKPESEAPI